MRPIENAVWAAACAGILCVAGVARAEDTQGTWEWQATNSQLSAGLPDGESVGLRANWALPGGGNLQAEWLEERKFGERGGVVGLSYTEVLSPDWFTTGTVVAGHGGPNWANLRADLQLSRKWLADRQLVTSLAWYRALFDASRNDSGYRLSAAWYLDAPVVLEAGVTFNRSQPGGIRSHMPYASATFGREAEQYVSLRVSRGTEAYQALGAEAQLVNFRSHSVSATWRRWLGKGWGVSAQAEHYRNPSYERRTLGVGLFSQW